MNLDLVRWESREVRHCEHKDGLIIGSLDVGLGCGGRPAKAVGGP
jgi:hypothetical protein